MRFLFSIAVILFTAFAPASVFAQDGSTEDAPYIFSAMKFGDSFSFSGNLPTDGARRYLVNALAGAEIDDQTADRPAAPEGFVVLARTGLDALARLSNGIVHFDGSTWRLSGTSANDSARTVAENLVANAPFDAAWDVNIRLAAIQSASVETAEEQPAPYRFRAILQDRAITLTGQVPRSGSADILSIAAGEGVTNETSVAAGAPEGFVRGAGLGIAALKNLDSGQFAWLNGGWTLSGTAISTDARDAAMATLARLGDEPPVRTLIAVPPPIELCRTSLRRVAETGSVLFDSGSDHITDTTIGLLAGFAEALERCPQASVYVEGHTDADGDAERNLALSLARSEAVIDELIALGIARSRLYAVGYGETLPIADNDTRDGKARNRRIVLTVEE